MPHGNQISTGALVRAITCRDLSKKRPFAGFDISTASDTLREKIAQFDIGTF